MKYLLIVALFAALRVERTGTAEFYSLMNSCDNAVLLDARVYDEFCKSRIPGAVWAGKKAVLDSLLRELDREATFFIYCDVGDRTKDVARILRKERIKRVVELEDGFVAWQRDNFPVDDENLCNTPLPYPSPKEREF